MKKCNKCLKDKKIDLFNKSSKGCRLGLMAYCKECNTKLQSEYNKTKKGILRIIYKSQKQHSKTRGQRPPEYSLKELREWAYSQIEFHTLFNEWKISGYKKDLKPSVDRKYDDIHYCFSNIQFKTFRENNTKNHIMKEANGYGSTKPVIQYDKKMNFIEEFFSIREAERQTGIDNRNINTCLKGKIRTSGGFIWKYKKLKG